MVVSRVLMLLMMLFAYFFVYESLNPFTNVMKSIREDDDNEFYGCLVYLNDYKAQLT